MAINSNNNVSWDVYSTSFTQPAAKQVAVAESAVAQPFTTAKEYLAKKIVELGTSKSLTFADLKQLTYEQRTEVLNLIALATYGPLVGAEKIQDDGQLIEAIRKFQVKDMLTVRQAKEPLGLNGATGVQKFVDGLLGQKTISAMLAHVNNGPFETLKGFRQDVDGNNMRISTDEMNTEQMTDHIYNSYNRDSVNKDELMAFVNKLFSTLDPTNITEAFGNRYKVDFAALMPPIPTYSGSNLYGFSQRNYSQQEFIKRIAKYAQYEERKHGIPASITIAQACLESGYGSSSLTRAGNALFGIKRGGNSSIKAMMFPTTEEIDGAKVTEMHSFRVYNSWEESIADHSRLLTNNRTYRDCFNYKTGKDWAVALQNAGYATDSQYANKLIAIINKYNLEKFDGQYNV